MAPVAVAVAVVADTDTGNSGQDQCRVPAYRIPYCLIVLKHTYLCRVQAITLFSLVDDLDRGFVDVERKAVGPQMECWAGGDYCDWTPPQAS